MKDGSEDALLQYALKIEETTECSMLWEQLVRHVPATADIHVDSDGDDSDGDSDDDSDVVEDGSLSFALGIKGGQSGQKWCKFVGEDAMIKLQLMRGDHEGGELDRGEELDVNEQARVEERVKGADTKQEAEATNAPKGIRQRRAAAKAVAAEPKAANEEPKERFVLRVVSASKLAKADLFGLSDPFAVVHVVGADACDWEAGTATITKRSVEKGGTMVGKTNVVSKSLNPTWAEKKNRFVGGMPEEGGCLLVEVWDHDTFGGDDFLGEVTIKGDEVARIINETAALGLEGGQGGQGEQTEGGGALAELPSLHRRQRSRANTKDSIASKARFNSVASTRAEREKSIYAEEVLDASKTTSRAMRMVAGLLSVLSFLAVKFVAQRSLWLSALLAFMRRFEDPVFKVSSEDKEGNESEKSADDDDGEAPSSVASSVGGFLAAFCTSLYRIWCHYSQMVAYMVLVVDFVLQGTLPSIVLPLMLFTVMLLESPRPSTWSWQVTAPSSLPPLSSLSSPSSPSSLSLLSLSLLSLISPPAHSPLSYFPLLRTDTLVHCLFTHTHPSSSAVPDGVQRHGNSRQAFLPDSNFLLGTLH
jgi:hypothetical protein